MHWLVLLVVFLGGSPWVAGLPADEPAVAGEVRRLAVGERVEREMRTNEAHLYEIAAEGRPFLILVEQRGVDVVLEVRGPDGESLGKANAPTDRQGPESFLVVPAATGLYRLAVAADPGTGAPGRYELRIEDLACASQARMAAEERVSEAGRLLGSQAPEARRQAASLYRASLADWRSLGDRRREAWALFAVGGAHLLSGEARLGLEALTEALPFWKSLSEPLRQADCLTGIGLAHLNLGDIPAAIKAFDQALTLQQSYGDRYGATRTRNNLCLIRHSRGELREALACYFEVLVGYQALGEPNREANTRLNMAAAQETLGELGPARGNYEQVLAYARSVGERRREAQALSNLAVLDAVTGGKGLALRRAEEALAIFRSLGDRSWEANTLQNLGSWYLDLGEPERSLTYQERALEVLRSLKDRVRQARALNGLGRTRRELGDLAGAAAAHREARELSRVAEARRDEALSLLFLGQTQAEAGTADAALGALAEAAERLGALGDRRMRAAALQAEARLRLRRGETGRAADLLAEALALTRAVKEPYQEADLLADLAELGWRRGALQAAAERSGEAMELVEALRTELAPPDLRASFLATQRRAFELGILVQIALHRQDPKGRHALASLEIAERARSRVLLDLLNEAASGALKDVDPRLLERRRSILDRLNALAGVFRDRPGLPETERQREIEELQLELDSREAEIRARSPRYAALTRPRVLRAEEIQTLADPDTLLLELALGKEKSFLWVIDPVSVQVFDLPPRDEIESAAKALHDELRVIGLRQTRKEWTDFVARCRALSRMILSPLAGRTAKRLAIVADGALHSVPFAILPVPDEGSETSPETFLIDRYEIVTLPSMSVLAAQRREAEERTATPRAVLVFADPVFAPPSDEGRPGFVPLSATRLEAEAIAALLPPEEVVVATGLAANRQRVLSDDLTRYRILHFATHGLIDERTPRLSGLALSELDAKGEPQEGFLSLADISNLRLAAGLVVLSGCETARGREVGGEGMIGLSRAFMHAGAERVVASLWSVVDRATAELIGRFYSAMLRDGIAPAAALREAQLSLRTGRRWKDPFYWAPFVIQGDWR